MPACASCMSSCDALDSLLRVYQACAQKHMFPLFMLGLQQLLQVRSLFSWAWARLLAIHSHRHWSKPFEHMEKVT